MKGYIYVGSELLDKIEKITDCEYEGRKGDLIDAVSLIDMVQDLVNDRKRLKEECDDLVRENRGCQDLDFEYEQWKNYNFLEEERD